MVDLPVFDGTDRLVQLIGALIRRARHGDRPRELRDGAWVELADRRQRAGRKGLPMVCLVRPGEHRLLLPALHERLERAKPGGVRCAYLAFGDKAAPLDSVMAVRDCLREARNILANSPRASDGRLRFPRFTLAGWLMDQQFDDDDPHRDRTLRTRIQNLGLAQRLITAQQRVEDVLASQSAWWRIGLWLLRGVTVVTFRIAVTGRVPLLSRQYRWFMRQPHLAPRTYGNFVTFARRLTKEELPKEVAQDAARLLVNAFLEDLRREYRLRWWQVWRKRRMTYPTLLLDDVSMTNGGYLILRLINDVRNQVGLFDPLLVISASVDVPPDAGRDPTRPRYDAANALDAYRAWQNQLLADRRARLENAWYLPIRIPGEPTEEVRRRVSMTIAAHSGYAATRGEARPAWWESRRVRLTLPAVAAAVAVSGLAAHNRSQAADHGHWLAEHCGTGSALLIETGTQCIGVTDGSHDLFQPSDPVIRGVEQTILQQNKQAATLHRQAPQRPYIALIEVEALTSPTNAPSGLTAEREALEGLAVAQWRQLRAPGVADPIVRVLIANAGQGMREGSRLGQQISTLATQDTGLLADSTLAGVVGLDQSNTATEATIKALTTIGIPMVADTPSADVLTGDSPMYFQVSPQNRREAAVAAAFADHLASSAATITRAVRIYYVDDSSDTYSTNLREDLVSSFRARGFPTEAVAFTPNTASGASGASGANSADSANSGQPVHQKYQDRTVDNSTAAGRDTCNYNGFAYFAGHDIPDFQDFMSSAIQCGSRATVIGDDDMSRYVADAAARGQNLGMPYFYESFALAPSAAAQGSAQDFYSDLNALFPFERPPATQSLDGHAALSFDAASVMITATGLLRQGPAPVPVTPTSVWREITAIHGPNNLIAGVSGTIDFGGDVTEHVPQNKPVAILRVDKGGVDPILAGFCGNAADHPASPWCP
ncbi:hypothetical protein KGA66_23780 [Actinocrinis puniceicyclus]|uniref:ABC-type branched-chain amino acid transport system, substrate-binding protein n=1 Tax=Actinocrinis puniceicyclus TaxID=977794 RepID=A0A8J7WPF2_9ACTN|nr:hypothetical protein [Actinocrinis puniceicyclus]MBS2966086.1 hypothetical protein [Actinocrinis puniceicyclus]